MDDGSAVFLRLNNYTGVAVKTSGELILIDPDIPGSDVRLDPDLILVSHSHAKHFTPSCVAPLASHKTRIIGTWKVIYGLKKMVSKCPGDLLALTPGNTLPVGNMFVEAHRAVHPYKALVPTASERFASINEGKWGEQHLSFAISRRDVGKIYHMSDSVPFSELKDIRDVEVAIIPLNLDSWNSPEEAVLAARILKPRVVLALNNTKKGGFFDRWSAKRECRRFESEMRRLGADAVFLGGTPYTYTKGG